MTFDASRARRSVAAWGAGVGIFFFVTAAPMVAASFAPAQAQRPQFQKHPGSQ